MKIYESMQGRLQILRSSTSFGLVERPAILWAVSVPLRDQSARFSITLTTALLAIRRRGDLRFCQKMREVQAGKGRNIEHHQCEAIYRSRNRSAYRKSR
ncbi:DNA-directed RNA polymerase III subunit RPC9-like [Iris pallida]|uniref:DNA-directed RNA polymerase III subunit RPC9-like n=1 Tax=Iris pallida TaxID=29817 RepID=A0AAX6F8J5_IRIPA|nr:DNA-directed RNA polymerase III subunit RPC9-like [Iris pallida]